LRWSQPSSSTFADSLIYPRDAGRSYTKCVTKASLLSLALWTCLLSRPVAADVIEAFDNGSNQGDWHLTSNPLRSLGIQPSGGDPGAYIRGNVESATPTWYVPLGTATDFLGDYYSMGVTKMSADINIFVGNQEPNRTLTLDLLSTFGTGDFINEVEAYYIGPNISENVPGWVKYQFTLDARSQRIPAGWVVTHGGLPGTKFDWQNLMRNVETLGFVLGQPGFAYTNHTVWDIGLDNPHLTTTTSVPEPSSLMDIAIISLAAAFYSWSKRARKSS
jgi:hypothetical protein